MSEYATLKSRYKIIDRIGVGGMSTVYVARDLKTNAIVAIKVLHPQFAINKNYLNRFFREIKIIATLNHPNILKLIDYGDADGIPYFVTEYIQGKTLKELLSEGKKFSIQEVKKIIIDVLKALAHAKSMGVIAHRDIKPGNIMIDKDGNVKLMDFGIAKLENTQVTQDTIMFTPTYASPEQIKGESIDIRSDLYSIGVTLYELLTGKPPFLGNSTINITLKHLNETPIPPSQLDKNIDNNLDSIVLKLLAKKPSDRYQKPEDVILDLEKGIFIKTTPLINNKTYSSLKNKDLTIVKKEKIPSFSIKGIYLLIIFIVFSLILTLIFVLPKNNIENFSILQINTEPTDVEIYLNGNSIGKSPIVNYKIKPGEYKISYFKEGYENKEEIIEISEKEIKKLNIKLNKLIKLSKVNIVSIPSNADIYIDNILRGQTPFSFESFIDSEHIIKLTKEGYETYEEKIILNEEKKELSITLKEKETIVTPKPKPTQKVGYLIINSKPTGAKVYINNEYKGLTPLNINLNPGNYKGKIEKDNYLTYSFEFQIKENTTTNLNYTLHSLNLNGTLIVYSFPENAEVYLNGEFIGYTPINKKEIKPGKYKLEIKLEHYVPYLTDFVINSGEEKSFTDIILIKKP